MKPVKNDIARFEVGYKGTGMCSHCSYSTDTIPKTCGYEVRESEIEYKNGNWDEVRRSLNL